MIGDIVRKFKGDDCSDAFVRAGPREVTHFDPQKVRAAIVTCGGLCPGLNSVIRELVHALVHLYDAEAVLGIRSVRSLNFIFSDYFPPFHTDSQYWLIGSANCSESIY